MKKRCTTHAKEGRCSCKHGEHVIIDGNQKYNIMYCKQCNTTWLEDISGGEYEED